MRKMIIIVATSLLILTTYGSDSCSERLIYLEAKVDRILNILESTFRTGGDTYGGGGGKTYGAGTPQSGGIYGNVGGNPRSKLEVGKGKRDYGNIGVASLTKAGVQDKGINGHAYIDKNNELELKGHNDELGYLGKHQYQDDAAAIEEYGKDEAYLSDLQDGYVFEADYSGSRTNDSIIATRRNIVRESQNINEEFFNDYNKENHEGDYNGNEFDLGYKTKEVYGGFDETKSNKEMEQNRYYDAANENDIYKKGNGYNKDIYTRQDDSKDYHGRSAGYQTGHAGSGSGYGKGKDGKYNGNEADLYDKYTGKESGKGGHDGYGPVNGFQSEREYIDKESDLDERFNQNEFNTNDKFGKSISKEDNVGVKQRLDQETQYNRGKYVDVEANGFNKNANYKGDYKNNKEQRKTGYTFTNDESVEEIGTPDRFNLAIINDNRVEYKGKERKSSINADRKSGKYSDREINKKKDLNRNAKAIRGNDYYGKKEKENENEIYYDARQGKDINRKDYKKGYNNGKSPHSGYDRVKNYRNNEPQKYGYLPRNDDESQRQRRNPYNNY